MDPLIGKTIHFLPTQTRQGDEAPRGGLGSQVLPVADLEDDFEGEPEDGMQYLFLVRREAQAHPRVHRAKDYPDPSQMIFSNDVPKGARARRSEGRKRRPKPSEAWRTDFLAKFIELRSKMAIPPTYKPGYQGHAVLPPIPSTPFDSDASEPSPWILFIQGLPLSPSLSAKETPPPHLALPVTLATPFDDSTREPSLAELKAQTIASLGISPPSSPKLNLLPSSASTSTSKIYHPAYPPHSPSPILLSKIKRGGILKILQLLSEESFPSLEDEAQGKEREILPTQHTLEWVLGLLTILSEVLDGDDLSTLRGVAKELRKYAECESVGDEEGSGDIEKDTGDETEERRAMCWMAVVAVAGIWRQNDIWDESLV